MAKTRARITSKGEVQGVGYRECVKKLAMEAGIFGRVRNLEDGTVEIIAEGRKRIIIKFMKLIDVKKYPIFVTEVSTTYETYKEEFNTFTVIRDPDMQKEMFEAISGGTVELRALSEKTDNMLKKQDKTIKVLDNFRIETNGSFADLGEKYHVISNGLLSIDKNIAKLHESLLESNINTAKLTEHIGLLVKNHIKRDKSGPR